MQAVGKKMVLIQTSELSSEGTLEKTEMSLEKEMKKQNRGTIVMFGKEVDLWGEGIPTKIGDVVSYFRGAATDVKGDDGVEYQLVNSAHILVKF